MAVMMKYSAKSHAHYAPWLFPITALIRRTPLSQATYCWEKRPDILLRSGVLAA